MFFSHSLTCQSFSEFAPISAFDFGVFLLSLRSCHGMMINPNHKCNKSKALQVNITAIKLMDSMLVGESLNPHHQIAKQDMVNPLSIKTQRQQRPSFSTTFFSVQYLQAIHRYPLSKVFTFSKTVLHIQQTYKYQIDHRKRIRWAECLR